MKKITRALAPFLAGAVLLGGSAGPGLAAGEEPSKEEVVYVNLSAAGDVQSVDVVNIFELTQPGRIVDHGNYASVRNMTTTDPVTLSDGTVTIDAAQAGRLYYEGSLTGAELPWQIALHYLLDGTERSASELAGASGALEIRLTVRENPRCRGSFFDDYSLQISFTLDGDRCGNITAEGATAANVGSDKQLTYMVLPGKEADITVRADVRDFEMDAVAINGVPLSLDVQVDDEELMAQVTDLLDAIAALDEGAGTLSEGMSELATGAGSASAGAGALSSGASELKSGAGALQSGGTTVNAGAYDVSTGAAALDEGVQGLKSGLDTLGTGLAALDAQSATLSEGSTAVLTGLQDLQAGLSGGQITDEDLAAMRETLAGMSGQLDGVTTALSGMSGIAETLTGIYQSYAAVSARLLEIINNTADEQLKTDLTAVRTDLDNATNGYLTALLKLAPLQSLDLAGLQSSLETAGGYLEKLSGLTGDLTALRSGVSELAASYAALDAGIQAYTQGVTDAYAGYAGTGGLAEGAASLAEGSSALAQGASTLYSGTTSLLGGIVSVYNATGTLSDGAGALNGGVAELLAGIASLSEGAGSMKEGTTALAENTDGMDAAIQEKIDALLASVTGGNAAPASFVSAENKNVTGVQFVIRTAAIQKPAQPEPEPEPAPEMSFWEKLTALF